MGCAGASGSGFVLGFLTAIVLGGATLGMVLWWTIKDDPYADEGLED